MIAVRCNTLVWQVLACIVAQDEPVTIEALAGLLEPPPKWEVEKTPYLVWRSQMQAHQEGAPARVRKLSRLVGRLQEVGLVETRQPPRLAPWFLERLQQTPPERWGTVLARLHPCYPTVDTVSGHHHQIVNILVEKTPPSVRSLLGAWPSGALNRAYADLVNWGAIIAPHHRIPTPKAIALIQGQAREAA